MEGQQDQSHHPTHQASEYGLTVRELEVLRLIAAGHQNKSIAAMLGISVSTATKHVAHVLEKLDVSSRTGAATKAVREGLIA